MRVSMLVAFVTAVWVFSAPAFADRGHRQTGLEDRFSVRYSDQNYAIRWGNDDSGLVSRQRQRAYGWDRYPRHRPSIRELRRHRYYSGRGLHQRHYQSPFRAKHWPHPSARQQPRFPHANPYEKRRSRGRNW